MLTADDITSTVLLGEKTATEEKHPNYCNFIYNLLLYIKTLWNLRLFYTNNKAPLVTAMVNVSNIT
jgi:hypothetical protein